MQRFTGLRPRQRAELGMVTTYLLLDGHASAARQGVLPPGACRGCTSSSRGRRLAGRLLHAKLASRLREEQNDRSRAPATRGPYSEFHVHVGEATVGTALGRGCPARTSGHPRRIGERAAGAAFIRELMARRFYEEEVEVVADSRHPSRAAPSHAPGGGGRRAAWKRPVAVHSIGR